MDGSDGSIHEPDSTITTAAELLTDMGGYRFKAIYTPDATGVIDDLNNSSMIDIFTLEQNYPNPFNPTTVIAYSVPVADFVTIKIYDTLGKEVRTVVDSYHSAGCHSVLFDAGGLASGVYLYGMHCARGNVTVKKMILMH